MSAGAAASPASLSLDWGWSAHNDHLGYSALLRRWRTPERSWGVAAGAQLSFGRRNDPSARPVDLSFELRRRFSLLALGVGPLSEPGAQRLGAQASFFAAPLVLRVAYLRGEGLMGYFGLRLFFPVTWVRTR